MYLPLDVHTEIRVPSAQEHADPTVVILVQEQVAPEEVHCWGYRAFAAARLATGPKQPGTKGASVVKW